MSEKIATLSNKKKKQASALRAKMTNWMKSSIKEEEPEKAFLKKWKTGSGGKAMKIEIHFLDRGTGRYQQVYSTNTEMTLEGFIKSLQMTMITGTSGLDRDFIIGDRILVDNISHEFMKTGSGLKWVKTE